jgi:hypothetical protein
MDYSFLRFEDNFTVAKQIKNSPLSSIYVKEVIQLLPNEHYLQISNVSSGISFDGDYQAYLIDCNGKELANITSNVAIFEFIDRNGTNQISIELYKIGLDFYTQQIFLKLVHTAGSDIYYSNSFCLTDYRSNETTRFDYFNNTWLEGISYDKVNFYQSIRLNTWFDILEDQTEVDNYYQISKNNTISNRPLRKQTEKYVCEFMNNFIYERANLMLCHDVIYIDGVRMTNKTTFKGNARVGQTNTFKTDFSCYKNYNDNYLPYPFIFETFALLVRYPEGVFSLGIFNEKITMRFNKRLTVLNGTVLVKNLSNNVVLSFNENDIIIGSSTIAEIENVILTNGSYKIEVSQGLFKNNTEISSYYEWFFDIVDGEFDSNDFNTQFLIN